jgi:hypothetical protein
MSIKATMARNMKSASSMLGLRVVDFFGYAKTQ